MCTTIVFNTSNGPLMANNEDIFLATGMLFSNQRGIAKQALIFPPEQPLTWVSRFGSLVFSQCGKEFPSGGMNEAGLVIEQMTLPETQYPLADERPVVKELQLIQYLLDTCASVAQALSALETVRIAQATGLIHLFLLDNNAHTAIVEFLEGTTHIYHGESLPVRTLTNSTYAASLESLVQPQQTAANMSGYQSESLRRFRIAAHWAQSASSESQETAFQALSAVARPDTIWQIVYSPCTTTISLKTAWNPTIRHIRLSQFEFSSIAPARVYDLHTPGEGFVESDFEPYSTAKNHELVLSFFRNETISQIFKLELPDELLAGYAAYPAQMKPVV